MTANPECTACGVTAADLPIEELGMTIEQAAEELFERDSNGSTWCQGCADGQ